MEHEFAGGDSDHGYERPVERAEFIALWEADNKLEALKLIWGEGVDEQQAENGLDMIVLFDVEDGSEAYDMAIAAKGVQSFCNFE